MSTRNRLIAEIKSRIRLPDLAAEAGVQLSNAGGGELAGKCPFHVDSDPSFKVYTGDDRVEYGRFKCFGCDATGDVIDFWARHRGISGAEARLQLAERLGLIQEDNGSAPQRRRRKRRPANQSPPGEPDSSGQPVVPPPDASEEQPDTTGGTEGSTDDPFAGLPRALTPEEGYAVRAAASLHRHPEVLTYLREKRRLEDWLIERAELGYDANIDRVILPVPGPDGRVVRCRVYDWRKKDPGNKMTWNTLTRKQPDFTGPQHDPKPGPRPGPYPLWALENTATVLLSEGEFDTLCAISLGVPAVTGTGGAKKFTEEWAQPLAGKRVVICYDLDPEGQIGVHKAARFLLSVAAEIRVLTLPLEYRGKGTGSPKDLTDWVLAGGTREQLEQLMAAAPVYVAPDGSSDVETDQILVLDTIEDAPVSEDAVVPSRWRLQPGGLYEIKLQGDSSLSLQRILPMPVVITARGRNLDTGTEHVELAWFRDGRWHHLTVDRFQIADRNRIVQLASQGLLVNSNNGRALVQYLADYEAANLEEIPERLVVSTCGLRRIDGRYVFMLGNIPISADEAPDVHFTPENEGDLQAVEALVSHGSLEVWLGLVQKLARFPRVMFAIYASFVPPLQAVLGRQGARISNFFIDFCGESSLGKTTAMEVAASGWGFPPQERGGLVKQWSSTRVFLERHAALMNHLPIFLDESHKVPDPAQLSNNVYLIANGVGKGRGAQRGGTQRTPHWQTVCFSTGEQPIMATSQHTGAQVRSLTLWGSPFGGPDQGDLVAEVRETLNQHHGLAGPVVVRALLAQADKWDKLDEHYSVRTRQLAAELEAGQFPPEVRALANRVATYLAAVWVAADLVNQAFKLEVDAAGLIKKTLGMIVNQFQGKDYATRALDAVRSWAASHILLFYGKHDDLRPSSEMLGVWRDLDYDKEKFVAFFPNKLQRYLEKEAGFSYESARRGWREKGLIRTQQGDGFTVPVKYGKGEVARMIVFPLDKWRSDAEGI